MKKRIVQVGVVVALVCAYLLYIQFRGNDLRVNQIKKDNQNEEQPISYSLNKVVHVFEKQNIKLKKDNNIDPKSFQVDNVIPHIYTVNKNKNRNLFIYVFNNISERKKALESYDPYSNYFSSKKYLVFGHETWNVLIMDAFKMPLNGENNNIKGPNIEQIIFKELNHGNVQTYKGETDHWSGIFTLKYYTHFWKDENGIEQIDNDSSGEFFIHYKMPIPKNHVKYNYELQVGTESESSDDDNLTLDANGNFSIEKDDMNVLGKEDVPTMTITWNKEKETIQFKSKK